MRGEVPHDLWIESSPSFHSLNRNKVGLTVNLKHPEGIELVKKLVGKSDLLIENWTSGTLDTLGLSHEVLHAANPRLVLVSLAAFGLRSRLDGMRSYGLVTSALSGVESMLKDGDDLVGSPTFVMSDPNAALYGLLAAMTGLQYAKQRGEGISASVSQLEAMLSLAGMSVPCNGSEHVIEGIYETRDQRYVAITLPKSEVALAESVDAWCRQYASANVLRFVRSHGGYAEELVELVDTPSSSVFDDLEVRLSADHPVTGSEEIVAAPWRINGRRPPLRKNAPKLGEGTEYVLRSILRFSDAEITALRASQVV